MIAEICRILENILNSISVILVINHFRYIPWNWHEPEPGVYLWKDDHDLVGFLNTAQDVGLSVILRAGPYICGEWDFVMYSFCCQFDKRHYFITDKSN